MAGEGGDLNNEAQEEMQKAQRELNTTTNSVKDLTHEIEAGSYSTETGVKAKDMIDKWLEQMLLMEKARAEMSATDVMRQRLDQQYLFYSPIGATLDRKDRHISFVEGNYMELLKALNAARLRQKNLQMSTATLRVLNPPMFPLNAQPTNRLMILLGAFLLTFMLTALWFFIVELLDRTLRLSSMAMQKVGDRYEHVGQADFSHLKYVMICGCGFPNSKHNFEPAVMQFVRCFPNEHTMITVPE